MAQRNVNHPQGPTPNPSLRGRGNLIGPKIHGFEYMQRMLASIPLCLVSQRRKERKGHSQLQGPRLAPALKKCSTDFQSSGRLLESTTDARIRDGGSPPFGGWGRGGASRSAKHEVYRGLSWLSYRWLLHAAHVARFALPCVFEARSTASHHATTPDCGAIAP